jgi:DNA-binding response OmpR family regulator
MSTERVYIVDDEITISKLLEMWVGQRWGYTTKVFENGTSFLNQLSDLPDLVLLDLMLPRYQRRRYTQRNQAAQPRPSCNSSFSTRKRRRSGHNS